MLALIYFMIFLSAVSVFAPTPDPDYFVISHTSQKYIDNISMLVVDLENQLSQAFIKEVANPYLLNSITQYQRKLSQAYLVGATYCIQVEGTHAFEEQFYQNLQQCEQQISNEKIKDFRDRVNKLSTKIQEILNKSKALFITCKDDISCKNNIISVNHQSVEELFWAEKIKIEELFKSIELKVAKSFHKCVEELNNPIFNQIQNDVNQLAICIESPIILA